MIILDWMGSSELIELLLRINQNIEAWFLELKISSEKEKEKEKEKDVPLSISHN